MSDGDGILLKGLDGSNPLAFLAALGTLRALTRFESAVTLGWGIHEGKWTPNITNIDSDAERMPELLAELLPNNLKMPWNVDKKLPFAASRLREILTELVDGATAPDPDSLDVLAAFGCEAVQNAKGQFEDTALRMVRSGDSAGQGFLDYACKIAENTTTEDLALCLFERWAYGDRGSSLRWDPAENREYALQAANPSGDGVLSVIGANRLAIESLALFPTQPGIRGLLTTGFYQPRPKAEYEFRWPIWTTPISLSVVRSLLVHHKLFSTPIDQVELRAIGIHAVFASRQVRPNQYYRNFGPARSIL